MSFTLSLKFLVSYLISSCVQVHSQEANKHYVLCLSKKDQVWLIEEIHQ